MPTHTFFNLPNSKKNALENLLLDTFYKTPITEVSVSQVLADSNFSRTSFYKYFENLEDSYNYITHKVFTDSHRSILKFIIQSQNNFFQGLTNYLQYCSELDRDSFEFKGILLMIKSEDNSIYKHVPTPNDLSYMNSWLHLLKDNKINITDENEALSFMYFSMDLTVDTLKAFIINNWSTDQLLKDFKYKVKWISHGII